MSYVDEKLEEWFSSNFRKKNEALLKQCSDDEKWIFIIFKHSFSTKAITKKMKETTEKKNLIQDLRESVRDKVFGKDFITKNKDFLETCSNKTLLHLMTIYRHFSFYKDKRTSAFIDANKELAKQGNNTFICHAGWMLKKGFSRQFIINKQEYLTGYKCVKALFKCKKNSSFFRSSEKFPAVLIEVSAPLDLTNKQMKRFLENSNSLKSRRFDIDFFSKHGEYIAAPGCYDTIDEYKKNGPRWGKEKFIKNLFDAGETLEIESHAIEDFLRNAITLQKNGFNKSFIIKHAYLLTDEWAIDNLLTLKIPSTFRSDKSAAQDLINALNNPRKESYGTNEIIQTIEIIGRSKQLIDSGVFSKKELLKIFRNKKFCLKKVHTALSNTVLALKEASKKLHKKAVNEPKLNTLKKKINYIKKNLKESGNAIKKQLEEQLKEDLKENKATQAIKKRIKLENDEKKRSSAKNRHEQNPSLTAPPSTLLYHAINNRNPPSPSQKSGDGSEHSDNATTIIDFTGHH